MATIEFIGACGEVTGSKIIIESNGKKLLLDCGMVQGRKDIAYLQNKEFSENIPCVDNVCISHSHIDHSGLLPSLTKNFSGKIYTTQSTKELCSNMLKDSVTVFTREIPVIKSMLARKNIHTTIEPLYTEQDVDTCLSYFKTQPYDTPFSIDDNTTIRFDDSCHILGSASTHITINEYTIPYKIYYTSDIGHNYSILCNEPKVPLDIDYLIIESTYGNKRRIKTDIYSDIANYIIDAYKRKGKVIIPAFSVGRMQTIIIILHKLHILGMIPDIPIFVDTPLGVKVTNTYMNHEDELNHETVKFFTDKGLSPLHFNNINYVNSSTESMSEINKCESCIILSSSGMCDGGRVVEHIKNNVSDKNSTILFVGYNAKGTLGRELQEHKGSVVINNEKYRVNCKIKSVDGLSAHADLEYLLYYIKSCASLNNIKQIYLVHGEKDALQNLKTELNNIGIHNVCISEKNKIYEL